MRSAEPSLTARLGLLALCVLLLLGVASGCATTQDTAARKQAQSKRILEAREERLQRSKSDNHGRHRR